MRTGGWALGPQQSSTAPLAVLTFVPTDLLGVGIFRQYDKIAAVRGLGEWRGSLRRHDPLSKTRDYSTKSN